MNIPKALVAPTPLNDPLEPNDDIAFVDGTAFRTPDPYVWRGFPHGPIRASVDEIEDPIDVTASGSRRIAARSSSCARRSATRTCSSSPAAAGRSRARPSGGR